MSRIRPFTENDIEQVAGIHLKVFAGASQPVPPTPQEYADYFSTVFLEGPWPHSDNRSLVCEAGRGKIVGFLGRTMVKIKAGTRSLWACLGSEFCVDPDHRGLVGPMLLREHLAGPQDLSFTDGANLETLKLWRWAGGDIAHLYSLQWTRPLRPARFVLGLFETRNRIRFLTKPIARLIDVGLTGLSERRFKPAPPHLLSEELELTTMLDYWPEMTRGRSLAASYDKEALHWYFRRTSAKRRYGPLCRVLVRSPASAVLGWYLYHQHVGNVGEVLQVVAHPESVGDVLDHLFHHAWSHGLVALSGRLDPPFAREYSDRYCRFSHTGTWTLIHSKQQELLLAFHRGEALLSRLEGEWFCQLR